LYKEFVKSIKELCFPPKCSCCSIPLEDSSLGLCTQCLDSIEISSHPICSVCGRPFISKSHLDHICGECILKPPLYSIRRSPFIYKGAIKQLIISFKYFYDFRAFSVLIELFNSINFDLEVLASDIVVPVPLHIKRLRERGFNQAYLIAKRIFHNKKVDFKVLIRTIDTPHQMGLKRSLRLKNVKDAFKVIEQKKIKDKVVLVVDDVITTGATITECSKELLRAGAKEVKIFGFSQAI